MAGQKYQGLSVDSSDLVRRIEYDSGDRGQVPSALHPGKSISPWTDNVVIVNRQNLKSEVISELSFVNPTDRNRLVTEIEYGVEDSCIYYDIKARDNMEADSYARVVTLNWWYQQLSMSLILASLALMDMFSNFVFCFTLFDDNDVSRRSALSFVLLFAGLEGALFIVCLRMTSKEWRTKADKTGTGDLIADDSLSLLDRWHAFLAMVFFKFIGLDGFVKDIVIWVHPWKNIQPYSAFKMDGHRCYLIGWQSEYMFRCDRMLGQHRVMPLQMLLKGILTTFKLGVAIGTQDKTSLVLSVPSLMTIGYTGCRLVALLGDRQRHWQWLRARYVSDRVEDKSSRSKAALEKQRQMHFPRLGWDDELRERHTFCLWAIAAAMVLIALGSHWGNERIEHRAMKGAETLW